MPYISDHFKQVRYTKHNNPFVYNSCDFIAISGAEGCKLPRGAYFSILPGSRQRIHIIFCISGVYWKLNPKQQDSTYLIFVTVATDMSVQIFFGRCKFLQI